MPKSPDTLNPQPPLTLEEILQHLANTKAAIEQKNRFFDFIEDNRSNSTQKVTGELFNAVAENIFDELSRDLLRWYGISMEVSGQLASHIAQSIEEELEIIINFISKLALELGEEKAIALVVPVLQKNGATEPFGVSIQVPGKVEQNLDGSAANADEIVAETEEVPSQTTPDATTTEAAEVDTTPAEQPKVEQPVVDKEINPEILAKIEALNFRSKTGEDSISKQIVLCLARHFGKEIRSGFISSQTGLKATKVQQEMVKKSGIIRELLTETGANGLRIKKVKENDRSCLYTLELVTDQQPSPGQPVTEESAQTDTEVSDAEQTV